MLFKDVIIVFIKIVEIWPFLGTEKNAESCEEFESELAGIRKNIVSNYNLSHRKLLHNEMQIIFSMVTITGLSNV